MGVLSPILFHDNKATSPMSLKGQIQDLKETKDASSSPPNFSMHSASTSPPKKGDLEPRRASTEATTPNDGPSQSLTDEMLDFHMEIKNEPESVIDETNKKSKAGLLKINLAKAKDLQKKDLFSKSDPYATIDYQGTSYKAIIVKNNHNPEWNHEIEINVENEDQNINVEVFNKKKFGKDDSLGQASVPVQELMISGEHWIELQKCKSGKILVVTNFIESVEHVSPDREKIEDVQEALFKKDESSVSSIDEKKIPPEEIEQLDNQREISIPPPTDSKFIDIEDRTKEVVDIKTCEKEINNENASKKENVTLSLTDHAESVVNINMSDTFKLNDMHLIVEDSKISENLSSPSEQLINEALSGILDSNNKVVSLEVENSLCAVESINNESVASIVEKIESRTQVQRETSTRITESSIAKIETDTNDLLQAIPSKECLEGDVKKDIEKIVALVYTNEGKTDQKQPDLGNTKENEKSKNIQDIDEKLLESAIDNSMEEKLVANDSNSE